MKFLLVLICVLIFFSCNENKGSHIIELDASKDNTIWINRWNNKTSAGIKIMGNINDDAILSMQHEDKSAIDLSTNIYLSKGNVKVNDYLGNLYGNKFKVVYYHKNVTKGYLKLTINF